MSEVWIIEDDLNGGIESVWADDASAIREVERLRKEQGYVFSVFCHQVRSDEADDE